MTERKLASVRKINSIELIKDADKICVYTIDGWKIVDSIGKYRVGELIVMIEIDSWISHALAPFLTEANKQPKVFEGIEGQRLRSKKMRGVISQGLILPIEKCIEVMGMWSTLDEGTDVTEWLKIIKWEKPIPACLAGQVRGNFPSEIPKTDAVRIQNVRDWNELSNHAFEVTEKLHGSSCTFYLDLDGNFHVCSRNMDLKPDENNAYWKIAYKHDIENAMRECDAFGYAIQGELIGEGINGNQYQIHGLDFLVFSIYSVKHSMYIDRSSRKAMSERLGLKHVPLLEVSMTGDIQEMLKQAEGKSLLNASEREGFVLKSQQDTSVIIKCISNKWLLKGGEDQ